MYNNGRLLISKEINQTKLKDSKVNCKATFKKS